MYTHVHVSVFLYMDTEIVYFKIYNFGILIWNIICYLMKIVTSSTCRRCFVEISSVIFGHLCLSFFKYEKIFILRMDMYLNVVNLRMSLKTLISSQIYGKNSAVFLSLEFMIDDTGEMAWYFLHIVWINS